LAIDAEKIRGRLAALDEYLRFLAVMAALDLKTFSADPRNYAAAERFMQLAAETVFDIGSHCLAGLGIGRPEN
jgi:uncharacterized protein YutE (UPF0331/DUF86 family)